MDDSRTFAISCLICTMFNVLVGYLLSPVSSKAIFKDTIDFIDDLKCNFDLGVREFISILPFLEEREYESLPPIKYVPSNIENISTLRNSLFIQRDAKSIVETSNLIWNNSLEDLNTYAQKSFDYVLNDIKYNLSPDQSAYGTNFYKAGTCYGKLNLYAALCRRRGIETRFKIIPFRLTQGFENLFLEFVPGEFNFLNKWIEKFLYVKMPHHFLEIKFDNQWYDANPIQPAFFYKLLDIIPPGVDNKRRKKSEFKMKKGYVKPIYMSEIYPIFIVSGSMIGKLKIADAINSKINEISEF